ncbi:membrane protein of unknown function [Ruminococcaceae bacterium BL-4]|nr:membrane protein of unknown function [Ruminococcaceae bacterium BL-4]
MITNKKRRVLSKVALALILLLAGFLSIFNIWNEGYSNGFYTASVKSMLTSWKNFFFVSLDPGRWVTVDKPPVSLWVQAAFAKVFGFYGWSILLPECLAAVATVAIIYHIVKRHFGNVAGLVSALVLALSPIFIVVSKTNNTDSVLILFMTLAAWAMMVAADKGQLRWLLLSAVFLGIAYNAKTLEAFLILSALYVDLTPASERPYVDNSITNSELELALGYNGIQRIIGQSMNSGPQESRSDFTSQPGNTADFEAPISDSADAPNADGSNPPQIPGDDQTDGNSGNTIASTTQQPPFDEEDGSFRGGRDGSNIR